MLLTLNLNPDGRDESVFVASGSSSVESLLPVQLKDEEFEEYVNTFFPKRRQPKGFTTSYKHYYELAVYMAKLSSFFAAIKSHINTIALESTMYDEATVARTASSKFARLVIDAADEGSQTLMVKNYLEGIRGKHVIVKTKDGFDILFSGLPGTCMKAPLKIGEFPINSASYMHGEMQRTGTFDKKVFKMALAVAQALNKEFAGQPSTIDSSFKRKLNKLPLAFDMEALMTRLNKVAGSFIPNIDLFGGVHPPKADPVMVQGLHKYLNLLVVQEAEKSSVDYMSRTPAPPPLTDETSSSSSYSVAFNSNLGFSFYIALPKVFASFITQTPASSEIPMVPLNTWVNIWTSALMKVPRQKTKGGDRVNAYNAPRYVLSASQTSLLVERRKALGFFSEPGRINEDGIFVSDKGRFNWCPPSSELALENAKNYESLMEEALKLSYDAGTPLSANQIGETAKVFGVSSPAYKEKIRDIKTKISAYAGSLQTFSWDYNVILTSSATDPERLVSYNLAGTAVPNDLSLADYLRKPFAESMAILFNSSMSVDDGGNRAGKITEATFGKGGSALSMLKSTIFTGIHKMYRYLLSEKKVPLLQDLVLAAAKDLNLKTLEIEAAPYDVNIYRSILDNALGVKPEFNQVLSSDQIDAQTRALWTLLGAALRDSSGAPGTNLAKETFKSGGDVKDDEHYFDPEFFTLGEFKNVYNYLGGRIFQKLCEHILKVPRKEFLVINPNNPFSLPDFQSLVKEIMPAVVILGKYAVQSSEIIERANALEESNHRNQSITASDIVMPGSKNGFQIFPHQLKVHQYLQNHPRYAVLDVAPGGGKTILLLADAASIVGKGLIKGPPCIFAPNGLVRNWVEDLHKVTEGKWNVIPITTSVYRTWGDERLTKLIKEAPRNTIVVMSTSVLKLDKYPIVIGNHVETVSAVLEFARKFGFEYIALDESHRGKNVNSGVHKALRQVMVASTVKYVRLATGTLIKDRLTDVVGQAALFNAQIFRTAEEYEAENSEQLGTYTVMTWKPNTPELARAQLSKHAAVITAKKKEWAFMLPRPIETFIPVRMEKADAEGGLVHQMMYDAILKETLEEIRQDKDVMALLQGHSDDEDDEDDDGAPQALPTDNDLDDATLADLESKLEPYLARLEQLLTDPVGDPFGEVYFGGMAKDNFVSNKVQKCIERIRRNFDKYPWVKGQKYKLKDLTDFEDQRYVLMGVPGKVLTLDDYELEYESHISPSKDPRWKLEPQGKVIVFCRYTRTVNAVYKALPPDLKKIAIKFHGEVKNKWEGFDQFRTSPFSTSKDPQILIANEQSITEGHNLQMASRIIRMESPWSPGELDQSSSRIFRPDPSKKFSRENVYLDWIICNGSLEVAKMGRLISKMLVKTQFDEAGNPLYASVAEQQLPLIRMSLETIASVPIISDIQEYIEAYANLVHIQAAEFEDMRQSGPSTMLDVPATPMFKEARIIEQVPYVPNLEVPDRHDFGLLRLNEYLQDTEDPNVQSILKDRQNLIGSYVHTEFGNGIISRVGLSRPPKVPGINEAESEAARRITRIDVQLANGDTYSGAPTMIFLATNVTKENVKDFGPTTKLATKRDKALSERARKALERQEAREAKKAAAAAAKNILGLGKKAKPTPEPEEEEENNNIELFPVVYNGFLALEGSTEDPEFNLRSYGFKQFGDYAYTIVKDQKSFEALLDYLDAKFSISTPIFHRLEALQDSFQSGRGRKFNVELAPVGEFKNFYLLRHKLSGKDQKGRPELKIYPVVLNGSLMLTVDIATNPAIKRHLNKVIPGTRNLKFEEASGLNIKFFSSRSELIAFVRSIRAEGVVVTNFAELKQELADLKTTQRV